MGAMRPKIYTVDSTGRNYKNINMFLSLTLTMDSHQGPVISSASIENTLISIHYIHLQSIGFHIIKQFHLNKFRKSGHYEDQKSEHFIDFICQYR